MSDYDFHRRMIESVFLLMQGSQLGESYQRLKESQGRLNAVIFSSRACGDVELEVANLIRIHPPWYGWNAYSILHGLNFQNLMKQKFDAS